MTKRDILNNQNWYTERAVLHVLMTLVCFLLNSFAWF